RRTARTRRSPWRRRRCYTLAQFGANRSREGNRHLTLTVCRSPRKVVVCRPVTVTVTGRCQRERSPSQVLLPWEDLRDTAAGFVVEPQPDRRGFGHHRTP